MGLRDLEKKVEVDALVDRVAVSITLNPQKRFLLFSLYEDETTSKLYFFFLLILPDPSLPHSLSLLPLKVQKSNCVRIREGLGVRTRGGGRG